MVFTAAAGTAANFATTLGSLTAVNSLEFTGTGTAAATTPVTVGGPGTLTINAGANTFAAGTGIVIDAGAAADTVSANLSLPTSETFINNSTSRFTVSGAIGSTAAGTTLTLNDVGGGGFLLSGANTYTGGTVITAGTTALGSSTALGNAGNTLTVNGGVLDVNGQSVTQSALVLNGGIVANTTGAGALTLTSTGAAINITAPGSAPGATVIPGYTMPVTTPTVAANLALTGATNYIAKSAGFGNPVFTGNLALGGATTVALADTPGDPAAELSITGVVFRRGQPDVEQRGDRAWSDFGKHHGLRDLVARGQQHLHGRHEHRLWPHRGDGQQRAGHRTGDDYPAGRRRRRHASVRQFRLSGGQSAAGAGDYRHRHHHSQRGQFGRPNQRQLWSRNL